MKLVLLKGPAQVLGPEGLDQKKIRALKTGQERVQRPEGLEQCKDLALKAAADPHLEPEDLDHYKILALKTGLEQVVSPEGWTQTSCWWSLDHFKLLVQCCWLLIIGAVDLVNLLVFIGAGRLHLEVTLVLKLVLDFLKLLLQQLSPLSSALIWLAAVSCFFEFSCVLEVFWKSSHFPVAFLKESSHLTLTFLKFSGPFASQVSLPFAKTPVSLANLSGPLIKFSGPFVKFSGAWEKVAGPFTKFSGQKSFLKCPLEINVLDKNTCSLQKREYTNKMSDPGILAEMEEIKKKLGELEKYYLGSQPSTPSPSKGVFSPVSHLAEAIEKLRVGAPESGDLQPTKLPSIPAPTFDGSDFEGFLKKMTRFFRLTGLDHGTDQQKKDWLVSMVTGKASKIVESLCEKESLTFTDIMEKISALFPKLDSDLTIRAEIEKIPSLGYQPDPAQVEVLFLELEEAFSRLTPGAMSSQDMFLVLLKKIHPKTFSEMRADRYFRGKTEEYLSLKATLSEKVKEDWSDKHLVQGKKIFALEEAPKRPREDQPNSMGKGKGKGEGKGKGKGQGKGKGKGGKGLQDFHSDPRGFQNKFGATIICKFCTKKGHYETNCWVKYPEKKPRKPKTPHGGEAKPPTNGPIANSSIPPEAMEREEESRPKRQRVCLFGGNRVWTLNAQVNGTNLKAIIDSGATISVISKKYVLDKALKREQSFPVQVANGETIFTLGTTVMSMKFDDVFFEQKVQVMDTSAFDAVLGLDFLSGNPRCGGILTQPPPEKLLFDGKLFPLKQARVDGMKVYRIFRAFKKESYTLVNEVKACALEKLDIRREEFVVDLFSNFVNAQEKRFCTRQNSSFFYNWTELSKHGILWANPPFSQLERVLAKVVCEPCQIVLVTPNWKGTTWERILSKVALKQYFVPANTPLYKGDFDGKPLPSPQWESVVSFIDTNQSNVPILEVDPQALKWVEKKTRNWDFAKLEEVIAKSLPLGFSFEASSKVASKDVSMVSQEFPRKVENVSIEVLDHSNGSECPPMSPIVPTKLDFDVAWMQISRDVEELKANLTTEVDLEFFEFKENLEKETPNPQSHEIDPDVSEFSLWLNGQEKESVEGENEKELRKYAKASGKFPMNRKQIEEISKLLHQRIEQIERDMVAKRANPFESSNIQGDFASELEKVKAPPEIKKLIVKYQDVFGPLPPPGKGCTLVEMDLELKDEWKDAPLRSKCWPMAAQDAAEIESQVEELIQAGLVEPFPHGSFPKYCSPTFLVAKKESKTRRMVGQYIKLNRRCKPHVAYLPNMEALVEGMASKKFKTKLDLRSGFWQIGLSPRAQELTAFTTPSGRVFRWKCMPFGLQGAPAIFQEMIETLLGKVKQKVLLSGIMKNVHIGAFFDDLGLSTNTPEEHLVLLEALLVECQKHQIRIKLSKCEFLQTSMEYLGFKVGNGVWSPSEKKVEAILKAKVSNLKELQSFLGAMNFFRRHVPRFSESSCVLTELLKKETPWKWGPLEEAKFLELKQKLAKLTCLGTPKPQGEMVVLTDSSDLQGGATIFQWQLVPHEVLKEVKGMNENMETTGLKPDGTLEHSYSSSYALVPLGHYSWKWNNTRQRYNTYEREILAGVLTMATQYRILAHQKVVWFCDNQATRSFLDAAPPTNPRLRRWYTFLSQFNLAIKHIPGVKNELSDWLSRGEFEELTGENFDDLAKQAFERMDVQLDFAMLFKISEFLSFSKEDYLGSEWESAWLSLEERKSNLLDGMLLYRTDKELFCETKKVVPKVKLEKVMKWCHDVNGHPGSERTVLFFAKMFYSEENKGSLLKVAKNICDFCEVCLKSKPNVSTDRGLVSSLPIPQLCNDIVYIDFISMDAHNEFNYVLTIVDGLSRFCKFIPCSKSITGEETLKKIFSEWIMHYDKPTCIMSDNDVRFSQHEGFYQKVFRSLGVEVKFSVPRHPQSNGLCERTNRAFLQNLRALTLEMKTMDWPKLTPIVCWMMNSQVNPKTNFSPSELFLGRPSWKGEIIPEPESSPTVSTFLQYQLELQESVMRRLQKLRESSNKRMNQGRTKANFFVGDYVLVSRDRWPQKKLKKVESQWFGPFRILEVRHNTLKVAVSPSMGGEAICTFSQVKHWRTVVEHEQEMNDFDPDDEEMEDENVEEKMVEEKRDLLPGYFMVSKILKHKFDQGWKFLTAWEGFPITSATWEPPKNFRLDNDKWNEIFEKYCKDNSIPFPPGRRRILVCQSNDESCCDFSSEKDFSQDKKTEHERKHATARLFAKGLACSQATSKREVRHQANHDRAYSWSGSGQPLTQQP